MKTWLIKIPPNNKKTASAFEDVLTQIHQTIVGNQVSLEISVSGQNIGFCCSADESTGNVFIGQIYAAVPDCEIVEIDDPVEVCLESPHSSGIELGLTRSSLYPLKVHTDFEGESLSGLLSVLSQSNPEDHVLVQIVTSPVRDTGSHHFSINIRKRLEKIMRRFSSKYWFKKGLSSLYDKEIANKAAQRLFKTSIRVLVASESAASLNPRLESIVGALSNFNTLDLNELKVIKRYQDSSAVNQFTNRSLSPSFLLSVQELATIFHLPDEKEVPNIIHVLSKKEAPPKELPIDDDGTISLFGETNFRDKRVPFGIHYEDRRRHLYLLGKSGSGKSKLLELLIKNDLEQGKGVAVLDPHGDLVDNVLKYVPEERIKDVVLFDPSDLEYPPAFNPLEQVPEEHKIRVTLGFIEIFKKLFGSNWSSRLEHVLRYTTLALLDTPNTTVLSILKMLTDKSYRQMIIRNIQDTVVKNFWVNEFASWSERFDQEAITPLLNKVGQFVATNMIRNIVGQPKNLIDFRTIMDNQGILLMKVPKGTLGEENASLLGAIVVTKIYQAAMSRADIPESQRKDFYFYVDEFHNFATDSFDEILSESRKYRLNLTIANQFLGQLDEKIQNTVFGNVGSLITFRVSAEDARGLQAEFTPRFMRRDIINLPLRDFCIKLSIDGEVKEAFSARTLDIFPPEESFSAACIEHSRQHYARPLAEVQRQLMNWEEGKYSDSEVVEEEEVPEQPEVQVAQQTAPVEEEDQEEDDEVKFEEPLI